jgi:DNA invertase Pin-like site-specific DNA recombinase
VIGRPRKLVGQESEVVAAYEAGATLRELQERYGVSNQVLHRILNEHALTRRPAHRPHKQPPEREERIVALYRDGESLGAVARVVGVDRGTVRRVLVRRGVPIDSSPGRRTNDPGTT